jgi:hypothetical protein
MRIERAIVVAYQDREELEELDNAECSLHKDEGAEHRCIIVQYNLLQATQPYEIWISSRLELVTRISPDAVLP